VGNVHNGDLTITALDSTGPIEVLVTAPTYTTTPRPVLTCVDIDECQDDLNKQICGDYAKCDNEVGTYRCTCITGYRLVGDKCVSMWHF
jgi:hypothetical protein